MPIAKLLFFLAALFTIARTALSLLLRISRAEDKGEVLLQFDVRSSKLSLYIEVGLTVLLMLCLVLYDLSQPGFPFTSTGVCSLGLLSLRGLIPLHQRCTTVQFTDIGVVGGNRTAWFNGTDPELLTPWTEIDGYEIDTHCPTTLDPERTRVRLEGPKHANLELSVKRTIVERIERILIAQSIPKLQTARLAAGRVKSAS